MILMFHTSVFSVTLHRLKRVQLSECVSRPVHRFRYLYWNAYCACLKTLVDVLIERVDFCCSIYTHCSHARLRTQLCAVIELSSIRTYMLRTFRRMTVQ